ncbi:hypothetical protein ABZY42_14035 [Streptomyces sp. NPDC006622]|uniref:hypothetical protein n=1 Tax=Streptomyces sp. NPDC006622 TaxID=3155459 RepID=UPI0033AEB128
MDTEKYLALADVLSSRELPAEDDGSDAGEGGPGFLLAPLAVSHGLRQADPALRVAQVERFHDDKEVLAGRLTERWGEPYRVGLQTIRLRTAHEEIPEPWAGFSLLVEDAYLWELPGHGRWAVLGVADIDSGDEIRLLLLVTETDPP